METADTTHLQPVHPGQTRGLSPGQQAAFWEGARRGAEGLAHAHPPSCPEALPQSTYPGATWTLLTNGSEPWDLSRQKIKSWNLSSRGI